MEVATKKFEENSVQPNHDHMEKAKLNYEQQFSF